MAKRAELTVGSEWAYSRSRNPRMGKYNFNKVVIVATEPMKWSRGASDFIKTTGLGVLVEMHTMYMGKPEVRREVVQLSQLHYTWSDFETKLAEYEVAREASEKRSAIAKAEKEKFMAETYNPAMAQLRTAIKEATNVDITSYLGNTYSWNKELPIEVINFLNEKIGA